MIGSKIKEIREAKGISQYRLAQITGINRSTIKRYETFFKKTFFKNIFFNIFSDNRAGLLFL